jgi:putative transposase
MQPPDLRLCRETPFAPPPLPQIARAKEPSVTALGLRRNSYRAFRQRGVVVTADVARLAKEAQVSFAAVCRALKLPRSSFYAQSVRQSSLRAIAQKQLDVQVAAIHRERKGRYGSPRVHQELRARGFRVGKKRVEASMRQQGLRGRKPLRFRRTTRIDASHAYAPNVLNRNFSASAPNQAWVGDITYVWTASGWAYLALLVDLCTRQIVGWAVSAHCDTALALKALDAAVARRKPAAGLLHHTDRGSTYTAGDYQKRLKSLGFTVSMSRRGNCWDNAVAESTIGSVKAELLADWTPEDSSTLATALFRYIEGFYNRERLHSSIGFNAPDQIEKEFHLSQKIS